MVNKRKAWNKGLKLGPISEEQKNKKSQAALDRFNYPEKFPKSKIKWLSWDALFAKGLDLKKAQNFLKDRKFFRRAKLTFSKSDSLSKELFFEDLRRDSFEDSLIEDLYKKAASDNIDIFLGFISEFNEIKKHSASKIEFWLKRGWSPEEARKKLNEFLMRGTNSVQARREIDLNYDSWFRKTRSAGGIASTKNRQKNSDFSSNREKEIVELLISRGHKSIHNDFWSPIHDSEILQIYNKRNFLHDILLDDKYIIEINGSYWHKDYIAFPDKFTKEEYIFEFKKAYNCLALVKRQTRFQYITVWEKDFAKSEDIVDFIESCLLQSQRYFSNRDNDIRMYEAHKEFKDKEEKHKKLFKNIVLEFAQQSHCESVKVSAIAVRDGRIIATGINGTPSGYINCEQYSKFLYREKKIKASYEEWIKTEEWRKLHHEWSNVNELHAEQSLICEAARTGIKLKGCEIYISHEPCIHCSKMLIAIRPNRIYFVNKYDKADPYSKILINGQSIVIEQI